MAINELLVLLYCNLSNRNECQWLPFCLAKQKHLGNLVEDLRNV